MNSKTCSVIVPIYNAEPYLAQCLSSIKMQTYTDLQVILVNDGSTDNSAAIAQCFVDADTRFSLFQQTNQGQSVARNWGLSLALGEYIVFVDADDYLELDFIQFLMQHIGSHDILQVGAFNAYYHITASWTRLYRRKFIEAYHLHFPEELRHYEDVIFSLNLWGAKPSYAVIQNHGYHYTIHPKSNSQTGSYHHRQLLYQAIRQATAPIWLKIYTTIRLKFHFLLQ